MKKKKKIPFTPTQLNRQSCLASTERGVPPALHLTSLTDLSLSSASFLHQLQWWANPQLSEVDAGRGETTARDLNRSPSMLKIYYSWPQKIVTEQHVLLLQGEGPSYSVWDLSLLISVWQIPLFAEIILVKIGSYGFFSIFSKTAAPLHKPPR